MSSELPKTSPVVSIIMPTYNHGEFLAEAIQSVCQQTLEEFELIVIDDGSTDGTPEILATMRDNRIRWFRTTNKGRSAARNLGLERASGRYLAFLDSDDLYHPDKLRQQVAVLERYPEVTLCFHDFSRFSREETFDHTHFCFVPELRVLPAKPLREVPESHLLEGDAFELLGPLRMLPGWLQTLLLRREAVRHFRFDGELTIAEDLAYVLRCYQTGRAAFIDRCLASIRRHGGNSFQDPFETVLPTIAALEIVYGEIRDSRYKGIIRRRLGDAWRSYGYHGWFQADRRKVIRGYSKSLSFPGRRIKSPAHLSLALICPSVSLFGKIVARRGRETTASRLLAQQEKTCGLLGDKTINQ